MLEKIFSIFRNYLYVFYLKMIFVEKCDIIIDKVI